MEATQQLIDENDVIANVEVPPETADDFARIISQMNHLGTQLKKDRAECAAIRKANPCFARVTSGTKELKARRAQLGLR